MLIRTEGKYKIKNLVKDNKIKFLNPHLNSIVAPPQIPIVKADTRATAHTFSAKDASTLMNLQNTTTGPLVHLPNSATIQAQQVGQIPILGLSKQATTTHVFKELKNSSLISIGQTYDDGCHAVFDRDKLEVFDSQNKKILTGKRNLQNGLWDVPLKYRY